MIVNQQNHKRKSVMKRANSYPDVANEDPSLAKADNPFDYKGIQPPSGQIADTAGENATNTTGPNMTNGGVSKNSGQHYKMS